MAALSSKNSYVKYIFGFVIELAVDPGNLLAPAASLCMFEMHDFLVSPVKVIGNKGYLLINLSEGIARQASPTAWVSTSNTLPHCGQLVFIAAVPLPFIS